MKNKSKSNLKIIDNDNDDFVNTKLNDYEEYEDYEILEESEDDLPVVVNEQEFLNEFNLEENHKSGSPSPPRNTVDYNEDEDDGIVYRDKSGKRITRDEWLLLNQKDKRNKKKEPKQELVWGKGLVQKEEEKEKLRQEEKIMKSSFQNYDIDDEYDAELKNKRMWNDPVYKKDYDHMDEDSPKNKFHEIPNRFNIKPGYRWDGVIRGNNYEQRWFEARANSRRKEREAYLQNISDL